MTAQVIPLVWNRNERSEQEPWQAPYLKFLSGRLDEIVNKNPMERLSDITSTLFSTKSEILGELTLTLIKKRFGHLIGQEQCQCPRCQKILNRRGLHRRRLETMVGDFELERPYFYCVVCWIGFYPLDAALGLSASTKQHDVQEVAAWLATEVPYDVASEALERCTGIKFGTSSIHECVNKIAQGLAPGDVCPTRAEIEEKIAKFSEGKRW